MPITLSELAEVVQGRIINAPDNSEAINIASIGLDSHALGDQAVFAAVPGTRAHGAEFAATDAAADALAVLTDEAGGRILADAGETRPVVVVEDMREVLGAASSRVYGDPSQELTVIGVTGTSGKTTTSYLLERGLMAAGCTVGLIGTTGTRIDGQPVPTSLTTPEAPTLQALFATMRDRGVTHVVMEVSSHALALGRVAGTHFDVAAFTNLSQDHLDFHPTMEDYFQAKALFFRPDSPLAARCSVIMVDDEWGIRMAELAGDAQTVSTSHAADISVSGLHGDDTGRQHFSVHLPGDEVVEVDLPLPGAFNVANATLALAAAARAGVDTESFARGMSEVAVPGRMERIDAGQDFLAVVDYAHKPAAVAAVLDTLRSQVTGRLGVVIGAGGDRDPSKRGPMGQLSAQRADLVIITDDNPRNEEPGPIRAAVTSGAREAAESADHEVEIHEIADRADAIQALVDWARPGDGIVVAGKGHEVGQLIKGVTHHFDDREQMREALAIKLRKDTEHSDD